MLDSEPGQIFALDMFRDQTFAIATITSSLSADRFLKQRSGCPPSSEVFFTRPGFELGFSLMGKNPPDRVKALLGRLHSITISKNRGSKISKTAELLFNKFVKQVDKIFKNLPKPLEWQSFYIHDLPLLVDFCEEVQEVSIQHRPWPRPDMQAMNTKTLPAK